MKQQPEIRYLAVADSFLVLVGSRADILDLVVMPERGAAAAAAAAHRPDLGEQWAADRVAYAELAEPLRRA